MGGTLGPMDDSAFLRKLALLDDYFEELKKCRKLN